MRWSRFLPPPALPAASPRMLAFVRIVVAGILLTSILWEDLPSSALLPRDLRKPPGVMEWLDSASAGGLDWLCRTPEALRVFQGLTAAFLLSALVGFCTRTSALLGAVTYLIAGGILRQYSWFYHTGLVPNYAMFVLALTPCGEAWSIDRLIRRRRGRQLVPDDLPRPIDAWSVFAVWAIIAIPYVMAGLSKIRAGAGWFSGESFKSILLTDALKPMHFNFGLSLHMTTWPAWIFTAMAVFAVATELVMGLVLVSRRARFIAPVMMAGVHVGIWLLQGVLFFDLIVIQALFLLPERWFLRRDARVESSMFLALPAALVGAMVVALGIVWVTAFEWYPITDMHMYTRVNRTGVIEHRQLLAHLASGEVIPARPHELIPAMADGRYRRILNISTRKQYQRVVKEFFDTYAQLFNAARPPEERAIAFEVIIKRWDYLNLPDDDERGETVGHIFYNVDESSLEESLPDAADPDET